MALNTDGSCACSCSQTADGSLLTLRKELKEIKASMETDNAVISLQMEQLCVSLLEAVAGLRAVTQLCLQVRCGSSDAMASDRTHEFMCFTED